MPLKQKNRFETALDHRSNAKKMPIKLRTNEQNARLHALIGLLGIGADEKAAMVAGATAGRSESSRDLTFGEAERLIASLESQAEDKLGAMRRKVAHLCCLCGMMGFDGQPDRARIDGWVRSQTGGKSIFQLVAKDLQKLVNQAEAMHRKSFER